MFSEHPFAFIWTAPSQSPKQEALEIVALKLIAAGSETTTALMAGVHPFASVTCTP